MEQPLPPGKHTGWPLDRIWQEVKKRGGYQYLLDNKNKSDNKKILELFWGSFMIKHLKSYRGITAELISMDVVTPLPGNKGWPDIGVMLEPSNGLELPRGFAVEIVEAYGNGGIKPEEIQGSEYKKIVDFIWDKKGEKDYMVQSDLLCFHRYKVTSPLPLAEFGKEILSRSWKYNRIYYLFFDATRKTWNFLIFFLPERVMRHESYDGNMDFVAGQDAVIS